MAGVARDHWGLALAQLGESIHVAVELALLCQESLHEWAVLAVLVEAPQQQLAKGAQGGQGVAQLVQ